MFTNLSHYYMRIFKYLIFITFTVLFSCNKTPENKVTDNSLILSTLDIKPPKEITENDFWVKVENMDCYFLTNRYIAPYKWTGGCNNFKINGEGVLTAEGHYTLRGTAKDGIIEGFGEVEVNSKILGEYNYKGNFQGNWIFGEGEITKSNGEKLNGQIDGGDLVIGLLTKVNGDSIYYVKSESVSKQYYLKYQNKINQFKWPELNTPLVYYYDSEWNLTKKKDAKYYRLIEMTSKYKSKNNYVQDYYIDGTKQNLFYADYIDLSNDIMTHYQGSNKTFNKKGQLTVDANYINDLVIWRKTNDNKNYEIDVEGNQKWVAFQNGNKIVTESKAISNIRTRFEYDNNGRLMEKGDFKIDSENYLLPISYVDKYKTDGIIERTHHINFEHLNWPKDSEDFKVYDKIKLGVKINNLTTNYDINFRHVWPFDINLNNDLIINYRAKESHDNRIILNWGQDKNTNTEFIFNEGSYKLERRFEGVNIYETKWVKHSSLKRSGFNDYKVIKLSDKILLSINGEKVRTFDNFSVDSKYIGFSSWGDKTTIKYFEVKEFIKNQDQSTQSEPNDLGEGNETWKGSGSGFILSSDGYIVTNHHVIDKSKSIEVTITNDEGIKDYSAELIKSDESIDLAILKINDKKFLSNVKIANGIRRSGVRAGEEVFALGYPLTFIMGEEVKFTDGRISSLTGFQGDIKSFQTTIPIQPGNSGGPMIDHQGNLLGITTSVLNKKVAENVSYSIKISNMLDLIEVLPFDIQLPGEVNSRDDLPELVDRLAKQTVFIKVK